MDLDPASWGGLELGLKIGPVKTSTLHPTPSCCFQMLSEWDRGGSGCTRAQRRASEVGIYPEVTQVRTDM